MVQKKIINSVKLPTLSKTLYEIIELEKKNPVTILKDLKTVIEKDPLLSAHILKVANSPLYGFAQKVRSIPHAVGLLGIRKIRSIAFAFSIFDFLKNVSYQPEFGRTFNGILKKCLLISALSTLLARRMEHINADELYLCGLLADIGQMILLLYDPTRYREIYSVLDNDTVPKEQELFGTDHIELGIEFCKQWRFPDFIITVIENHYKLHKDDAYSKIAFIANELAEFLLAESDESRKTICQELENYAKKLLRLSLSEIEETIEGLPEIMESYINDFPEVHDDLNKIVATSSSMILTLMKREIDMVILTQELSVSQEKLAREKRILSHMLNLSYFFSSLLSPAKIISSLFEYFDKYIDEFHINFVYKVPDHNDHFLFMECKEEDERVPINIADFNSLNKACISNETVRMSPEELERLGKDPEDFLLVFPISFHHNLYGYLLLILRKDDEYSLDIEIPYIQILTNIIANAFQNHHSFLDLKKETHKKEHVTRELFRFDRQLNRSRRNLQKLQKSEIMAEILPVIFHKLKNKLTPVLGYSQILLNKVQDENLSRRIEKIEKNANDLTEQLDMLRNYFKYDTPPKERNNINNVIGMMKPYFDKIQSQNDIKIHLDLDYNIKDDYVIPGHIEFLICNLVDNAIQAITAKVMVNGAIHIRTCADDDSYSLSVRDNGIGIADEMLHNIWVPFFSGFPNKTGLGLSVCDKILNIHSASYHVESEPGKFTEVLLSFRRGGREAEEIEEPSQEARKKNNGGSILIVDDEAYLVDLMKEILLNEGAFNITTTTDGQEGLELASRGFDMVITDIRMPQTSGMDIYKRVKAKNPDTVVMMVTADPFSDDVVEFLRKEKIDYIKKPFELMEFKKRVLEKLLNKNKQYQS